jgi:hypothetical protein
MVEHFSQDLEGLVITGHSFTVDGHRHALWNIEAAFVDPRQGRLSFAYVMNVLSRPQSLEGISTFLFDRTSPRHAPTAIHGFSQDLNDAKRIPIVEVKVWEAHLPLQEALQKAMALFP